MFYSLVIPGIHTGANKQQKQILCYGKLFKNIEIAVETHESAIFEVEGTK
jgi:hypothetical protein